jgi:hypothetical protein
MKKKRIPTKAQRDAMDNWARIQREWDKIPKFSRTPTEIKTESRLTLNLSVPPGRETPHHPSLVTPGGDTSKLGHLHYTGTEMIGIAQMSKSNAVPVFAKQEAIDIARMRRN